MKIVFFEAEKWECDILQQACCNHEVVFTDEELGTANVGLYRDADIISPFVHSVLDHSDSVLGSLNAPCVLNEVLYHGLI